MLLGMQMLLQNIYYETDYAYPVKSNSLSNRRRYITILFQKLQSSLENFPWLNFKSRGGGGGGGEASLKYINH